MSKPIKEEVKNYRGVSTIYISIPFCRYRCSFCCFTKNFDSDLLAIKKLKTLYIKALKKEIAAISTFHSYVAKKKIDLKTIYFGGGTPSLLEGEDLYEILTFVIKSFEQKINRIREISIEATPDSLTFDKVKRLKSIGFNRISIGIQTFNQSILNRMNRKHSVKEFYNAYKWIRSVGFNNVNIDLIYGFPSQTFNCFKTDLDTSVRFNPEHLSVSPLHYNGQSFVTPHYFKMTVLKGIQWAKYAYEFLENNGYKNYYHKYFSKKGKEFISELVYRYNHPHIGIGAGAESSPNWMNCSNAGSYIANPYVSYLLRRNVENFEKNNKEQSLGEKFLRSLLFPEGVCISYFNKKNNCDIEEIIKYLKFKDHSVNLKVKRLQEHGIIEKKRDYIKICPELRFSKQTWQLYSNLIP